MVNLGSHALPFLVGAPVWLFAALLQWLDLRKQERILAAMERAQFRPAIMPADGPVRLSDPAQQASDQLARFPLGSPVPADWRRD
jgi:hypothetical protein